MSLTSLSSDLRKEQIRLSRSTTNSLAEVFAALSFKALDASANGWVTAAESIARKAHREAIDLGASFYLDYRREAGVRGKIGITRADFDGEKLRSSLIALGPWQAKHLLSEHYPIVDAARTVFTMTAGSAVRRVLAGSRETIQNTSFNDGYVGYWRRVTGPHPCGFCAMVAMNLFNSEASATFVQGRGMDPALTKGKSGGQGKGLKARGGQAIGEKYHDHCQCHAIPAIRDAFPDGYVEMIDRFKELWVNPGGETTYLKPGEKPNWAVRRKDFYAAIEREFGLAA